MMQDEYLVEYRWSKFLILIESRFLVLAVNL